MYDKKIFAERIKENRNSRKETQKEFGTAVNNTAGTISAYENGTKNPSLEVVANIANKCNISIDWLCGLSDKKQINRKIETYSDILSFLYEITISDCDSFLGFSLHFQKDSNGIANRGIISFNDETMVNVLYDFDKIYYLYNTKTITDDMYTTLIEGLLKKYNHYINDLPF